MVTLQATATANTQIPPGTIGGPTGSTTVAPHTHTQPGGQIGSQILGQQPTDGFVPTNTAREIGVSSNNNSINGRGGFNFQGNLFKNFVTVLKTRGALQQYLEDLNTGVFATMGQSVAVDGQSSAMQNVTPYTGSQLNSSAARAGGQTNNLLGESLRVYGQLLRALQAGNGEYFASLFNKEAQRTGVPVISVKEATALVNEVLDRDGALILSAANQLEARSRDLSSAYDSLKEIADNNAETLKELGKPEKK
jgi:hypothetical protein